MTEVFRDAAVSRRAFIGSIGLAGFASSLTATPADASLPRTMPTLSCNTYPWMTLLRRDGRNFDAELTEVAAAVAATGYTSIEPNLENLTALDTYGALLDATGLTMPSAYMNSVLHDPAAAAQSISAVVAVAREAQRRFGTHILVTNPSPISWGGPENKTDEQIRIQGRALGQLGAQLQAEGITLAYHNHDSELRLGGREFHHMLAATDPVEVKFCLDAHWVFRGCGDSSVALFDVVELYGDRIVELHLRQSSAGVWDETFSGEGDIDYPRLFAALHDRGLHPLLTMEQAVEERSPHHHDATSAHRTSCTALRQLLAPST